MLHIRKRKCYEGHFSHNLNVLSILYVELFSPIKLIDKVYTYCFDKPEREKEIGVESMYEIVCYVRLQHHRFDSHKHWTDFVGLLFAMCSVLFTAVSAQSTERWFLLTYRRFLRSRHIFVLTMYDNKNYNHVSNLLREKWFLVTKWKLMTVKICTNVFTLERVRNYI